MRRQNIMTLTKEKMMMMLLMKNMMIMKKKEEQRKKESELFSKKVNVGTKVNNCGTIWEAGALGDRNVIRKKHQGKFK